jgi:hypothetical protein
VRLTKIRDLDLSVATSAGQHSYLSAASGLVFTDQNFYVVADDEFYLGVFDSTGSKAGTLIRLFEGELPSSKEKRKARKPDLETLMRLPPFGGYPHGALFAIGSGSKRKRRRGVLLALDAQGRAIDTPRIIDMESTFDALDENIDGINIEGGIINGDELQLLQRGNKRNGHNALVRFQLSTLLDALSPDAGTMRMMPLAVHRVDLGGIGETPLCFTDGAALPNGDVVFSAVAENTEDNYNDGPCMGAAIGVLDREGKLRCLHQLDQRHKIEGIDAQVQGGVIRLRLVTDADDASVPAGLFSATLVY